MFYLFLCVQKRLLSFLKKKAVVRLAKFKIAKVFSYLNVYLCTAFSLFICLTCFLCIIYGYGLYCKWYTSAQCYSYRNCTTMYISLWLLYWWKDRNFRHIDQSYWVGGSKFSSFAYGTQSRFLKFHIGDNDMLTFIWQLKSINIFFMENFEFGGKNI